MHRKRCAYRIIKCKFSNTNRYYECIELKKENEIFIHSGSFLFSCVEPTSVVFSSIGSNVTFNGSGTIILETTKNNGFKFIPLEGRGKIQCNNESELEVKSGRMVLILDKPSRFGDAYDIDLMLMLKTSKLINAYPDPLDTFGRISLLYTLRNYG